MISDIFARKGFRLIQMVASVVLCLLTIPASAQLTIVIDDYPDNTPVGDTIFIAGDFQSWNPASKVHAFTWNRASNTYYLSLPADLGPMKYKFTRGNWAKVECTLEGGFQVDRAYTPIDADTLYQQIAGWDDLINSDRDTSTAAENVEVISDSFYMPELDQYRKIWVYVPPNYAHSDYTYPVLYLHDGQNAFDRLTAFGSEWQVDETLNELYATGDTGIIVVAIENGGKERIMEYTPWPNPHFGGGKGADYSQFIVNTLKPYIDQNYRTKPDQPNTGIMGSSLGGLISTYGGIEYQNTFGKIGAMSPAYWFNQNSYAHVSSTGKQADVKIYQVIGSLEGQAYVDQMFAMEDTLHAAGFGPDEIRSVERTDGEHSEWFWAREFKDAYLWLFRDE